MKVPIAYSFRSLWTRRLTTFLTASGMALVVFVFAAILMLAEGLQKTLVQTGSPDNVVVLRKGSTSEVDSGIERDKASVVETLRQIAPDEEGGPLAAKEVVILITLPKKRGGTSNVTIRGIGKDSLRLRPQVKLIQGRMPRFG
ncbi:MAG TPA: ABC transporter permease, partial [Deltaproteobacteria bacterium]|nr:ABC transporter permease [Deltaproteobacteria bacterium]